MANKLWIVVGVFCVLIGGVLIYQWQTGGQQAYEADLDTIGAAPEVPVEDRVAYQITYEGAVEVDGARYTVSYKRLAKPLLISESFIWPRDLDTSPTHTALSNFSMIMGTIDEHEFYSCYEDENRIQRRVQENMNIAGMQTFNDYLKYGRGVFLDSRVLGEITADGVTLVVVQLAPEPGRPDRQNVRIGTPVVRVGDRYLIRSGAKETSRVLRELSADNYSLLDDLGD